MTSDDDKRGMEIPGGSRVTAVTDTPSSELKDISNRHVDKRMALPDFSLDDGTDVLCLIASTVDEQASTYEQIMKSEHRDQWLKTIKYVGIEATA